MRKPVLMLIILITAAIFITTTNTPEVKAATPTIAISKVYNLNQTGTTFLANITVANANQIFGWVMNLSWDPSFITITTGDPEGMLKGRIRYNIYEGDFMRNASSTSFLVNKIDNTAGTIKALACYFSTTGFIVTGSGILASINFTLLNVGTGAINITGPRVSDGRGGSILLDRNGQQVAHEDVNGLVTDQPPPPPPPFWTEPWFQTMILTVLVVVVLPVGIITGITVRLRRTPPVTDEDLEKFGEFDEEVKGKPLPEDSE